MSHVEFSHLNIDHQECKQHNAMSSPNTPRVNYVHKITPGEICDVTISYKFSFDTKGNSHLEKVNCVNHLRITCDITIHNANCISQ